MPSRTCLSVLDDLTLTKIEKSKYADIKRSIFIVSQKLGSGLGVPDPVPYDTAWVARVPKVNDLNSPAFPRSLQWIRDHQQGDGSWGAHYPPSPRFKTLNTLTAVVALAQWNYPEDKERIRKGNYALWKLAKTLQTATQPEFSFAILITALVADARELQLNIPFEYYQPFCETGREKLKKFESEMISDKPNELWCYLETCGGNLNFDSSYYQSEIIRNGFVAAQPSTTSFILRHARLNGRDFPEAEWALQTLYSRGNGGIPHLSSFDNFEAIMGLQFLLGANIDAQRNSKFDMLKNVTDLLTKKWRDSKHGISFSSKWQISDIRCSKNLLSIFNHFLGGDEDFKDTKKNLESLVESNPIFLDHRNQHAISEEKSLASDITGDEAVNNSKSSSLKMEWNLSEFFGIMQAAFEISRYPSCCGDRLIQRIKTTQNIDGGWGGEGTSSTEESAYVCLAVFHLVRLNYKILDEIDFLQLIKFMQKAGNNSSKACFWILKVPFQSSLLSETVLCAAKYAIFQMQRLRRMTNAFNENKLDFSEVKFTDENNGFLGVWNILRVQPDRNIKDIKNIDKRPIFDILIDKIFQGQRSDSKLEKIMNDCIDFSRCCNFTKLTPHDRALDASTTVGLFLVDDIVDVFLRNRSYTLEEINNMFSIFYSILKGESTVKNTDYASFFDFPQFSLILNWITYLRRIIEERQWDPRALIAQFHKGVWFGIIQNHKDLRHNVEMTPKRCLQIYKREVGMLPIIHVMGLLNNSSMDTTKFEDCNLYMKLYNCAEKVCRLIFDICTYRKDIQESLPENFCLYLKNYHNISLREAVALASKKTNKEILKMYAVKKIVLRFSKYKDDEQFLICLHYIESFIHASFNFCIKSSRYTQGCGKLSSKRICHVEKDEIFIRNLCFN